MSCAPITLFIYNRPEHAMQTLESLYLNTLAMQSDLYIFADGPKQNANPETLEKIRRTREIAHSKQWCKNVTIIESDKNKGLAASIISGVTEIVNKYGKVIVLEDDLVTSPYFLQYMNDALSVYENEPKVACIHGYVEPHKNQLPETFFIRGADCWGWATWKRAWDVFNPNGQQLLDEIHRRHCERHFNFDNSYDYVKMLEDQIAGRNNSWAIRWLASAYLNDMYCLYPDKNLVLNIGFDGSGTHCGSSTFIQEKLADKPITIVYQEPTQCLEGWTALKELYLYRKRGNRNLFFYFLWQLKNIIMVPALPFYRFAKKLLKFSKGA